MSANNTHEEATKWGKATETSAARYSQTNGPQHGLGNSLNGLMRISEGQHVLVTACGPGSDVFAIARIVGPTGKVIGFDLDKHSIEQARKALDEQHSDLKSHVELHVCDVHDMSMFKGQAFDAIHCNASYHWFTDKPRFLAGAAQLAKPGACIGIATQDRDFATPTLDIRREVLTELGEDSTNFVLHSNAPELRHDLDAAGWGDIQTQGYYGTYTQPDGLSMFTWLDDSSGRKWSVGLEGEKKERMKEMTLEKFKGISLPDGRPVLQLKHLVAVAHFRGK